ncbi:hypothetical protein FOZ62_024916, partial [Perkinsus olseni]
MRSAQEEPTAPTATVQYGCSYATDTDRKLSIPLQWMKYCPECAKETSSMPERGATNVHYSLWKRTLAEAGALLDSSRMLEEEKIPSRRIFDICDLIYAFAVCAEKHIPERKREELVKGGVPARLLAYFIEDPERFTKLTVVQLGRLVWSAAILGLLGKNEAAKAITEALRKDERYKELSGRNLVRVAEALKGVSQAHPGRRHLGDRIMGQVLRQRSDLQKMGLLVEGLRAAGQLTVVNSVTQHKLVDLFLKVIIPEAGTAGLLAIPGCLDSIKLADDVVGCSRKTSWSAILSPFALRSKLVILNDYFRTFHSAVNSMSLR